MSAAPVPPPKPAKPTAHAAPVAVAAASAPQEAPPAPPAGGVAPAATAVKSVAEILATDSEDESLRKYKASLLGAAVNGDLGDTSDPRRVVITEFRVMFEPGENHPDMVRHFLCINHEMT